MNSIGEGECLFLSLAHTACRAHPEDLLYPLDEKLLKGQKVHCFLCAESLRTKETEARLA